MNKIETLPTKARSINSFFTPRTLRRIIQIGVLGFILYLVFQRYMVGENNSLTAASAEAYCPFGGLESLISYLSAEGSFLAHTHLSNLVMLIAVLALALIFRSAFCGWVCPLGFIQEIIASFSKWAQKHHAATRRTIRKIKKASAKFAFLDRYLRMIKYFVLAWSVGGAVYYGYLVFRDFDPWAAFLNILEFSLTPGMIILLITIIASLFIERPWCRYACPLGAASGLLGKLSPAFIHRDENKCTSCQLCSKSCPMGLTVHSVKNVTSLDCVSCLECVNTCPQEDALEIRIGLPLLHK